MNNATEEILEITTFKNTKLEQTEKLVVNEISHNRFKIIRMPSKLFGLGFGDILTINKDKSIMVKHQGFVGCRIYGRHFIEDKKLEKAINSIKSSNGIYELYVNRANLFLFLVGFHVETGWSAIQEFCDSTFEDCKWEYSNVFDENNQFLEWWKGKNPDLMISIAKKELEKQNN